ncbi:MAG: hypothetical protein ABI896_06765 [Actinomycetota bacterium]
MSTFENVLESRRFNTIMLSVGVAVLLIGAAVFLIRLGGSDNTSPAPANDFKPTFEAKSNPLKNSQGETVKTYQQLDPPARAAIRTFIATAVARKNLARSWAVIAPSMKTGYTLKSWSHAKALPVIPYPVDNVDNVSYFLHSAATDEVLVDVGLSAKPSAKLKPLRFRIGVLPAGTGAAHKQWLVDYWMPLYTPIVPKN